MQHAQMAQSVPAMAVSAGRVYLENAKLVARRRRWGSHRASRIAFRGYFERQGLIKAES